MHRREHPNRGSGADRAPRACGNRCRDGGRKPRGRRRGHTRERIRRSRSRRRRMERHRRRRAGRDTRQRRRERQSQSRNRSPGPPDGVPERDVRGNAAPCRRDGTGTARNRRSRQNRAGTDTVRVAHQKLIGRSRAAGQLGRAEQGDPMPACAAGGAEGNEASTAPRQTNGWTRPFPTRRENQTEETWGGMPRATGTPARRNGFPRTHGDHPGSRYAS